VSTNFVDLVRSSYAALARGDVALVVANCDPDVEIMEPPARAGAATYRGHEGLIEALRRIEPDARRPERFIDAGRERVIVVTAGGVDLHTGKSGRCIRWEMFGKLDEAFAAIGLRKLKGDA
jgi:ketosteroid isomerase-like protein